MRVLLTGGGGMLGSAVQAALGRHFPDATVEAPTRADADLTDQRAVARLFDGEAYDLVVHAAARVGGIRANLADPWGFCLDNLAIGTHLLSAAADAGVARLVNIGSSCMFPRDHAPLLLEEHVLAGPLEPTNEGYALAKIAAARLCAYRAEQFGQAWRTLIFPNLYGPRDHFGTEGAHLVAAALWKVHEARETGADSVTIWGDGEARREFMFVEDAAEAVAWFAGRLEDAPAMMNVGCGRDHTVNEYYRMAADVVGYEGRFEHDLAAPVGMTRKLMDSRRAFELGWSPSTSMEDGMERTYAWLREQALQGEVRG